MMERTLRACHSDGGDCEALCVGKRRLREDMAKWQNIEWQLGGKHLHMKWAVSWSGIRTNKEKSLGTPCWHILRSVLSHSESSQHGLQDIRSPSAPHPKPFSSGWTAPWWGSSHCQWLLLAPTSNALISAPPKRTNWIAAQLSTYSDFSAFKPVLSFTKFRQLPKSLPNGPSCHSTSLMGMKGGRRENAKCKGGACLGLESGSATCGVCMGKLLNLSVLWFPYILCCK